MWYMEEGPHPRESKELSELLQSAELIRESGMRNRGVKTIDFHVNRESNMPSSLVEVKFITNKNDANGIKNDSFLNKVAKAIVNGIIKFFGMR